MAEPMKLGITVPGTKPASKFNPNGQDYDYERAMSSGMGPAASGPNAGHWGSVAPVTTQEMATHGLPEGSSIMLKGSLHPTWDKAIAAENARGSNIQKRGDRYFSVPQPSNKQLSELLDSLKSEQNSNLTVSIDNAVKSNADVAAADQKLSSEIGLPPDVVARNRDKIHQDLRAARIKEIADNGMNPALKKLFADPEFAKIAHPDVDGLSVVEQSARAIKAVSSGAVGTLLGGGIKGTGTIISDLAYLQTGDKNLKLGSSIYGIGESIEDFSKKYLRPSGNLSKIEQVAEGVGQAGGQVALWLLSPAAKITSLSLMLGQGATAMEEMIKNDPVSREALEVDKAAQRLTGGVITAATNAIATKFFISAPQALALSNKWLHHSITVGLGAGVEGITEYAENVLHDLAGAMTNPESKVKWAEAQDAGEIGVYVGAIVQSIANAALHIKANKQKSEFEKLQTSGGEQGLKQKSPDAYNKFSDSVAAHMANTTDGPVTEVYIDRNTFKQALTANKIDPVEVGKAIPSITDQVNSVDITGDIVIPMNDWIGKVIGTDIGAILSPHARGSVDATSLNEVQQATAMQPEMSAQILAAIAKKQLNDDFVKSSHEVQDIMFQQLKQTGRYADPVSRINAQFVRDFVVTQAANQNMMPMDFFNKYMYKVAAEGQAAFQQQDKPYISWGINSDPEFDAEGNESEGEDFVKIDRMYVPESQRQKGLARAMLRNALAEIQKEHPGMTIKLSAEPFGKNPKDEVIDTEDLVKFYESEGFSVTDTRGDGVIMEHDGSPVEPMALNEETQNLLRQPKKLVDIKNTYVDENRVGIVLGTGPGIFGWHYSNGEIAPPISAPTPIQGLPNAANIGRSVASILSSTKTKKLIEELFGITNLKAIPINGMWKGSEEASFILTGDGMDFDSANELSKFLGLMMSQEATLVTQPTSEISSDNIPAFYMGYGQKLTPEQLSSIANLAKEQGINYSTTADGRAIKVLYFDGEAGFNEFKLKIKAFSVANGFTQEGKFEIRSNQNDTESIGSLAGQLAGGIQGSATGPSDLFRRSIDNILAPYAKAVAAEGYRFSADRFAERFGLSDPEREYIRTALYPKKGADLSTAGIIDGTETLEVAKSSKAKKPKATNNDIMFALQNRAGAIGQIEPGDYSAAAQKIISEGIASEIISSLSTPTGKSAVGWYDRALKAAKKLYYSVFPTMQSNDNIESFFNAVLGIASQGADVFTNSTNAGRMNELILNQGMTISKAISALYGTFGKDTRAIENNYEKLEFLLKQVGKDKLRAKLSKTKTVGEWNKIFREDKSLHFGGEKIELAGKADQKVTGWMAFGPKIGSFINNLSGDYSTLTADLWFSRTWNRFLGYVFVHTPQAESHQYDQFRRAVLAEASRTTEPKSVAKDGTVEQWEHGEDLAGYGYNNARQLPQEEIDQLVADPDAMFELATYLEDMYRKGFDYTGGKGDGYSTKSDLRRAAKNWIEGRKNSVALPRTDSEREFQQSTMEIAQKIIKRKTGIDITIADMQAVLWYHEKELFGKLGSVSKKAKPADYEDAAREFVNLYNSGDLFLGVDGKYLSGSKGSYLKKGKGNLLKQVNPTFFSALSREIGGLSKIANKDGMVKPDQAIAWITARQKEGKFKKAEVDAVGLMDYLALRKTPVAVMTIEEFVKEKGVQIEEVMLGKAPEIEERSVDSFIDEALEQIKEEDPEQNLHGPDDPDVYALAVSMQERYNENAEYHNEMDSTAFSDYQEPGGEDYKELLLTLPRDQARFYGNHFHSENIVAHVRFNTRTDADGNKVLFLEELQSDWAQGGKKQGFSTPKSIRAIKLLEEAVQTARERQQSLKYEISELPYNPDELGNSQNEGVLSELKKKWSEVDGEIRRLNTEIDNMSAVPTAPFVTDTQAWTALILKRMLRYAVDNGINTVSWTTGEMQAKRYDLSRYVSEVHYDPKSQRLQAYAKDGYSPIISGIVAPDKLADYIGKDAAGKLLAKKTTNIPTDKGVVPTHVLKKLELKVGGEGMAAYYDAIVPQVAKKIIKSIGGELGKSNIEGMADTQAIYITPEMRDNILGGQALFQPVQGQDEARGGFDPTTLTTILGTEADNSTFLHETAHFFLSVYADMAANPNATEQSKQDMQTILDWFGVKDLATWNQMSLDEQRKYHEQFAYNYEIYLFEGKAPNIKLQTIFDRFSAWLARVYKSIRDDLNAIYRQEHGTDLPILTGEVRQVMDRMLATSEQIKQTETVRNMVPIFQTQEQSGMDDSEWAAYQEMSQEATNAAIGEMQTASLRQMKWLSGARSRVLKEMQKETAEIRKSLRDKIVEEVKADPVYRAINWLKTGETVDQNGNDIKVDAGYKLSIAAVKAMYPESDTALYQGPDLKILGMGKQRGMMSEDGLHPDLVAEMFGFKSGDDLVRALVSARKFNDEVNVRTDERMLAEHAELQDPKSIEVAVESAIHNEARARFVSVELRHLAKATAPVRVMLEAARQAAVAILASRPIGTIKPKNYAIAEARAAQEAIDAIKKGDTAKALEAKRNQLLNNQLAAEAIKANRTVAKSLDLFKKVFTADSRIADKRDMNLVSAARAILANYGMGKTELPAGAYLAKVQEYDPEFYAEIEPMITAHLQQAKPITELTTDQFTDLSEQIQALWHLSRRNKQMEIDGKMVDRNLIVAELVDRVGVIDTKKERRGYDKAMSDWDKRKIMLMGARAAMRRVESWVDAMDGGKLDGPFRKYIWNPISEAVAEYRIAKNEYLQKYLDIVKSVEKGLAAGSIDAGEIGYTFKNKAELLHAILHTGNESNKRKLLLGRGWAEENQDGSLNTARWDNFMSRMYAENKLSKVDFDFAQSVWDLLEEMKPAAQKVHKDMYGFYFSEISANPVITPFGVYRGGYVPAVTDPWINTDAAMRNEQETGQTDNSYMFPTTGRGFTKGRVEYNKPLMLDLGYFPSHLDKVLRFIHIEPKIKDVAKIVKTSQTFSAAMDQLDPTIRGDMLVPWLQRTAMQMIKTPMKGAGGKLADKFFSEVRTRTGMQLMVGNITNALQQLTGISIGALKVRPANLRNALWLLVRQPTDTVAMVSEKSKFMLTRMSNQQFEISKTIEELLLNPSKYDKLRAFAGKHGYFMQQGLQNTVDTIVWVGAYNQSMAETGNEKDAVRAADSAVRLTQGSFAPEDVSRFETGNSFVRAFTMFYSYFNMQANLLGTEFTKTVKEFGVKKGMGHLLYIYTFAFMIPAVLSEIIVQGAGGFADGDDDEWDENDAMALFFGSQARTAMAMVPIVGPSVLAGVNAWNSKPYDDRISTSASVSALESTVRAPNTLYKAIAEDGSWKKAVRDTLTALGMITGLPLGQMGKPIGYAADIAQGKVNPESAMDVTRGVISGKDVNRPNQ